MLRFAVVGCGRIARRHCDLLGTGQIAGATLVAVCDVKADRARQFAERYHVAAYTELDEMLARDDVDAVSVLTPSGMHADISVAVAKSGRHVVVEKPIALTLADADRMNAAADAHGVRLFVVKQNRFNVPVVKAREALVMGRLG